MARKRKPTRKTQHRQRPKRTKTPHWVWPMSLIGVLILVGAGLIALQTNYVQATTDLASPEILAQGEAIYNETCAACHGPEGAGNVGPPLNSKAHAWHHVDNQLRSFIGDGIPGTAMVGHSDHLSDAEIDTVISYLKSLWTPEQRRMQLTGRHPMP